MELVNPDLGIEQAEALQSLTWLLSYVSIDYIPDVLAKAIVQAKVQTELTDSVTAESGRFDIYSLLGQTPNSAPVQRARNADAAADGELEFGQHESHLLKRRTTAEKLGNLRDF